MRIVIEVIKHKDQRYETTGDWLINRTKAKYGDLDLLVRVSEFKDWRHSALVGVHELIEAILCFHDGVSQEAVDNFDLAFEEARQNNKINDNDEFEFEGGIYDADAEPGDCDIAPYANQHEIATAIEAQLADALDVNWEDYNEANLALYAQEKDGAV